MDPKPWPLRKLGLKVLDLESEIAYYEQLGLVTLEKDADQALLGFEGNPVLELRALRSAGRRRPPHTAGLYHFALLLPDEPALGAWLRRCAELGIPLDGAADHLVSQAIYLSDPEGNGIEVYADRARETWAHDGDRVRMATLPLDFDALMRQAEAALDRFPETSRLGHMHLNVGDLARAVDFYTELGQRVTAAIGPFGFTSWDGYHHHMGLNLLQGRGAEPVAEDVAGLDFFEIARPGLEQGEIRDPDGISIRVAAGPN
jgi:catechol 2,3-dioxygenase